MGIKYGRERLLDQRQSARLVRPPLQPPKLRMSPKKRLLIIYSGILLFCAFIMIGEMYLRLNKSTSSAPLLRGVAVLESIDTESGVPTAVLRVELEDGNIYSVATTLEESHQALRPGQQVGVLARWVDDAPLVVEVSATPLPVPALKLSPDPGA